jgi:hypothetical protein
MTGSCRELGLWQPANSLQLITSPADFPIWKAELMLDPSELDRDMIVEYKYLITSGMHGEVRKWEAL